MYGRYTSRLGDPGRGEALGPYYVKLDGATRPVLHTKFVHRADGYARDAVLKGRATVAEVIYATPRWQDRVALYRSDSALVTGSKR